MWKDLKLICLQIGCEKDLNSILEKAYGLSRKDSTNENKNNQGNKKGKYKFLIFYVFCFWI